MDIGHLRAAGVTDPIERFEELLTEVGSGERGHVALTAPPHGCTPAFLSHAEARLDAVANRSLAPGATPPDLPGGGVVLVEGCHHLYTRRIDGFDALDSFLRALATADCTAITSWNQYAWAYLDRAKDVGSAFTAEFSTPTLSTSELSALFESLGPLPSFEVAEPDAEPASARRVRVPVTGWEFDLPIEWTSTDATADVDPRKRFFEALASASAGHPGVAEAIWEQAVTGATASPGDIVTPSGADLTDEAAFLLLILVSNGVVERDSLSEFVDDPARPLYSLRQQKLAARRDDRVVVTPAGLATAVAALERRRLLW